MILATFLKTYIYWSRFLLIHNTEYKITHYNLLNSVAISIITSIIIDTIINNQVIVDVSYVGHNSKVTIKVSLNTIIF